MPIDPRELQGKMIGEPVQTSTLCRRCGYDLTGLASGGRCPECGAAIGLSTAREGRYADNLADTPPSFLRTLLASVTGVAIMAVALPVAQAASEATVGTANASAFAAIYLAVSIAWLATVWLVTRQRERVGHTIPDATLDSPKFRLVLRALQCGWVLDALLALIASQTAGGAGQTWVVLLGVVVGLPALVGLGLLAYFLRAYAEWAGEDGLAARYLTAAWGLSVCTTLTLLLGLYTTAFMRSGGLIGFLAGFAGMLAGLAFLLAFIGHVLFLFCNLQLAWMVRWALKNNHAAAERDLRVAERKARREAEIGRDPGASAEVSDDPIDWLPTTTEEAPTVRPLPKPQGSIPLADPDDPPPAPA